MSSMLPWRRRSCGMSETWGIHQGIPQGFRCFSHFLAVFSSSWGRVYTERRLLKEMQISFFLSYSHIRSRANPVKQSKHIETSGETSRNKSETNRLCYASCYALQELAGFALRWAATIGFALRVEPDKTPPAWPRLRSFCQQYAHLTHVYSCSISMFFNVFPMFFIVFPFLIICCHLLPYRQVCCHWCTAYLSRCGESQGCWRNQQCQRAALSATDVYWAGRCGSSSDPWHPWVVCFAERRLSMSITSLEI